MKLRFFHAIAAIAALLMILIFWTSTIFVEISGTSRAIYIVKHSILMSMIIFIPFIIFTGLTGNILARNRAGKIIQRKKKRMAIVAVNGIIILLPSAIYLNYAASLEKFTHFFYGIQSFELLFGFINMSLLVLNIRDGLRLRKR